MHRQKNSLAGSNSRMIMSDPSICGHKAGSFHFTGTGLAVSKGRRGQYTRDYGNSGTSTARFTWSSARNNPITEDRQRVPTACALPRGRSRLPEHA